MEFLEVPLYDDDILKLLVRFTIDLFFLSLIVVFAIYPIQRQREFAFTAVMMNITVFFICFSLKKLDLGLGMALGLFAIFGVLRYRTDAIGIQEMTYLFIVIGLAVINSLSNKNTSYAEVGLVNTLILASAVLKQQIMGRREPIEPIAIKPTKEKSKEKGNGEKNGKYTIEFDQLHLLAPEQRENLLNLLKERTGMNIVRYQVQHVDLPANRATLAVWNCDAIAEEVAATPEAE